MLFSGSTLISVALQDVRHPLERCRVPTQSVLTTTPILSLGGTSKLRIGKLNWSSEGNPPLSREESSKQRVTENPERWDTPTGEEGNGRCRSVYLLAVINGIFKFSLDASACEENALKTSVNEFRHWLRLVPDDFEPHFIATKKGGKAPLVPKNRSWKEEEFRLSEGEARRWLEKGGNVAFVARRNLAVIDVDDEAEARKHLNDYLFDTLTVSTRSGGTHLYFVNGGVENADMGDALEVRVEWRYLLTPGSYVAPGDTVGNGRYEVVDDTPPALLVPDDLPEELRRSGVEEQDFVPVLRKPGEPFQNEYGWTLEGCRKDSEKLDALLTYLRFREMPKKVQGLFDPNMDHSKSGLDMSTAYKLAYYEFDFQSCMDILREYRPHKKTRREDYLEGTVKKALSRKKETVSDHHDPEIWKPEAGDIHDRITIGSETENE